MGIIEEKSERIESDLRHIVEILLLNGTLLSCPGLVHGKMGIAVFFFHYARYSGNSLYEDYAVDLIEEMQTQLYVNSPADYEKGTAGIGVGVDYLVRNGFLKESDDMLVELDQRMFSAVMLDPLPDFTLYYGLIGYGRYWISWLSHRTSADLAHECLLRIIFLIEEKFPVISINEQTDVYCFLYDLQGISGFESSIGLLDNCQRLWNLQANDVIRSFPRLGDAVVGNIVRAYHRKRYFNDYYQDEIDNALKHISSLDMDITPASLGLLNGYAGEGMLRLTAINKIDRSWLQLL